MFKNFHNSLNSLEYQFTTASYTYILTFKKLSKQFTVQQNNTVQDKK